MPAKLTNPHAQLLNAFRDAEIAMHEAMKVMRAQNYSPDTIRTVNDLQDRIAMMRWAVESAVRSKPELVR